MQQESDADPTRVAGTASTPSAYQAHARVALHGEQGMSGGRACLRPSASPWGLQGLPVVSMVPGAPAVALLARCTTEFVHRCSSAHTLLPCDGLPSCPASLVSLNRHMAAGRPFTSMCRHGLTASTCFAHMVSH